MKIKRINGGVQLWLSANDTYNWAHRPNNKWPCSQLSDHRLYAEFDATGDLVDVTIDGKTKDCPTDEFNAITSDFIANHRRV